MPWWKLDWRSRLGERCRSPRQLARHTQNRAARSLVGSTARTFVGRTAFRITLGRVVATCQSAVEVAERPVGVGGSHCVATCGATRVEPQPSRMWLCRRLRQPLPLTFRNCRCGHRLDKFGHHRAACSRVGVLGKRGFPLECAAAQVCREAGGRVSINVFILDLDLAEFNALDNRRVEVIADGLPLWHGAKLAIDNTLVPPCAETVQHEEELQTTADQLCKEARRRKERTYPELVGEAGRARLVVLAADVESSARVQCGKSFCRVFAGKTPGAARWRCAFDTCDVEGCPFLCAHFGGEHQMHVFSWISTMCDWLHFPSLSKNVWDVSDVSDVSDGGRAFPKGFERGLSQRGVTMRPETNSNDFGGFWN